MSAAEDLRSASRDNPTPGTWIARRNVATDFDVLADYGDPDEALVVAEHVYSADAYLVVTLHRTIDAQLAILREAHADLQPGWAGMVQPDENYELQTSLARAILGET